MHVILFIEHINTEFSPINDVVLYKRRFTLGSRIHVNRYIQQFTEIFTEEGRKSVKITHQVQGHPPRVMYTHSMREKERLREKEEKQQQLQQQLQQQQQPAIAQQLPVNKEATETQPTNGTPIPIKVYSYFEFTLCVWVVCFFLNRNFLLSDGEPSNIGYHYQNGLTRESQVWPGLTGHSLISFQPTFLESATTAAGNKGKNQISFKIVN